MWVSKVSELIGSSTESFEQAASSVVSRAHKTLRGITGIEVLEKSCHVQNDQIVEYRVRLRLVFDVAPRLEQRW
jgi:flavin-binding protein dodecin